MTASLPANHSGIDTDGVAGAALDSDAAPAGGAEPDTAGPASGTDPDVPGVPEAGPDTAARTILDGPALENEEMRRGTEELRSSQDKIAEAREFADDVARQTEPGAPARAGDDA